MLKIKLRKFNEILKNKFDISIKKFQKIFLTVAKKMKLKLAKPSIRCFDMNLVDNSVFI